MSRDENAMAASQAELNEAHATLMPLIAQYNSGLITITEFISAVSYLKTGVAKINLTGLMDPNTGLQYPTLEEIQAFEDKFNAIPIPTVGA